MNLVGVLDTATGAFLAKVPVGVRPFALDVTPDGKRVYVPNHDSGSITVIDTATNTVAKTIRVAPNPHWLDVSKDGTRVYAANHESNVISTIDTANNAVLGTVPVGTSPHSVVAHPDKALVLNVNYDGDSVSVTDTNTNAVQVLNTQTLEITATGPYREEPDERGGRPGRTAGLRHEPRRRDGHRPGHRGYRVTGAAEANGVAG